MEVLIPAFSGKLIEITKETTVEIDHPKIDDFKDDYPEKSSTKK
jgi:hypothetical protein